MKKSTLIIPFPRPNARKASVILFRRQTAATDEIRQKRSGIADHECVMIDMADWLSSQMPNCLYDLMNEQCDVLVEATQTLVKYMEDGGEKTERELWAIWKRSDGVKDRLLELFERASTTAVNSKNILRAIITLDMAIHCARTTTNHVLDLEIPADRIMLELAAVNRNCAQALQRGFYNLQTNPFQADEDACAARSAKPKSDKIYRYALAELGGDGETVKRATVQPESLKAISDVFGMLQRREIYYHFSKSTKRLVRTANSLVQLLVNTECPKPSRS